MISAIASLYGFHYPRILVYMLQSTEYRVGPYLTWYWRTQNFGNVMHRRTLKNTKVARLLQLCLAAGMLAQIAAGFVLIGLWRWHNFIGGWQFGLALLLSYPVVWAHLIVIPLILGRELSIKPKERRLIKRSESIFAHHSGIKIAVAGSYGKTSMKELLVTVLSEGKKVAATPANKNVAISHAQFASKLAGDEDILIIEYGEGAPGDVARFTRTTHPTHAVITGLAPAHLDRYKTVQAAGKDIFAVARKVPDGQVYVNGESPACTQFMQSSFHTYGREGALGWKVERVHVAIDGIDFELIKDGRKLKLHSGLLGKHNIGPLVLAAALALEFGLNEDEVRRGIAKTAPFEHRMQPYQLSGAWIIDDTYNGNIEGIRAGTELLADLPARRKLYVTPGLVDQGKETKTVHQTMGELIATAKPDEVVLIQNSVTRYIQDGLKSAKYSGSVRVERDPLEFYTNLQQFIAAGDLVLMQNDWTDNYA